MVLLTACSTGQPTASRESVVATSTQSSARAAPVLVDTRPVDIPPTENVRNQELDTQASQTSNQASSSEVGWRLGKGNVWVATGTPPACPEPLTLATPVDLSLVTSVLYPGQPRGDAFKPHGGFRFDNQSDNHVTVKVPFDAQLVRGSRAFRNGENQYAFEFIAPCGIYYWFGHLLELTPRFQAIADSLPLADDKHQFFSLATPVSVATGELIATAVGYAANTNVTVDWGALDLRRKNGARIRPEWAEKYSREFDEYAICWLDLLSADDTARVRALPGGDAESGKMSDYCH